MFKIEEIQEAEQRVKSGADFPQFAATLKGMGITRFDVYVINGLAIYFGEGDETVEGTPAYESLLIEPQSSSEELTQALKDHQSGKIDYVTFGRQAASAGVEKWVVDLKAMNVSYLDSSGNEVLVENISFL